MRIKKRRPRGLESRALVGAARSPKPRTDSSLRSGRLGRRTISSTADPASFASCPLATPTVDSRPNSRSRTSHQSLLQHDSFFSPPRGRHLRSLASIVLNCTCSRFSLFIFLFINLFFFTIFFLCFQFILAIVYTYIFFQFYFLFVSRCLRCFFDAAKIERARNT